MLQLERGGCECDNNAVRRWKATARSRASPTDVLRCASSEIMVVSILQRDAPLLDNASGIKEF
jgi:hypothetical protein